VIKLQKTVWRKALRVRKKKNGAARFEAARDVITEVNKSAPERVDIKNILSEYGSYRLEVGCGKGAFAVENAKRNGNVGFIAMEVVKDVIIFAAEKAKAEEISNLRFVCGDADVIDKIFDPDSFDIIYINFCDPWPKKRHAKRRLTCRAFLEKFKPLLKDGGRIEFKTDNRDLFDFSLPEFDAAGFDVSDVTYDLHQSEYASDNIMTEYEKNFSEKGFKINRLVAKKP